jgi:DNA-binding transcriptional MerR regulator
VQNVTRAPVSDSSEHSFAIDELAKQSGVTVRTIRAHQSRRLLHPPHRVGRRSLYDESHVERLALIRRLQNSGFSLAAIRALVQAGTEAGELALAWRAEAITMRFLPGDGAEEAKLAIEPDGLSALLRQPGALDALAEYGITRRDHRGTWQGTHPVLVEAGRRARELGLPSHDITRVQLAVAERAEAIAREVVAALRPHLGYGRPEEAVAENYAVLTPIATAIVTATFEIQLARVLRDELGIS